jgi:penicillin-binding protein 1A
MIDDYVCIYRLGLKMFFKIKKYLIKFCLFIITIILLSGLTLIALLKYHRIPTQEILSWQTELAFEDLKQKNQSFDLSFRSAEGMLLSLKSEQPRRYVPIYQISPWAILSVIASEDERFWTHSGFDIWSMGRAVYQNFKGKREGASTITQQLCKLWIGNQKTLTRKIKELALAIQVEQNLSKAEIITRYLNEVYFGTQAYGIEQASRTYFKKSASALNLSESALLAGIIPQPSVINPVLNLKMSIWRAKRVLRSLARLGWISEKERKEAELSFKHLKISNKYNQHQAWAPNAVDEMEKQTKAFILMAKKFKNQQSQSLTVHSSIKLVDQQIAQNNLFWGILDFAKKQGFYDTKINLSPNQIKNFQEKTCKFKHWQNSNQDFQLYVVTQKSDENKDLDAKQHFVSNAKLSLTKLCPKLPQISMDAQDQIEIKLSDEKWLKAFDPIATANPKDSDPQLGIDHWQIGDVLWVDLRQEQQAKLMQNPFPKSDFQLQGSMINIDKNHWVTTLIGSYDYAHSQFNRATQSCRPMGSLIKPFIYLYALQTPKYQLDTLLSDAPISIYDQDSNLLWKPRDHHQTQGIGVPLKEALARSLNLPTLHLTQDLGISNTQNWLKKWAFEDQPPKLNFALGSGCVRLIEMTEKFSRLSHFIQNPNQPSIPVSAQMIDRIESKSINGKTIIWEQSTKPKTQLNTQISTLELADEMLLSLINEVQIDLHHNETRNEDQLILKPESATQIDSALQAVFEIGTGQKYQSEHKKFKLAGKTGSTDLYDAWFIGYQPHQTIGIWVGNDQQKRAIGDGEGGGSVALPIVINWLKDLQKSKLMEKNDQKLNEKLNFSESISKKAFQTEQGTTQTPMPSKPSNLKKQMQDQSKHKTKIGVQKQTKHLKSLDALEGEF